MAKEAKAKALQVKKQQRRLRRSDETIKKWRPEQKEIRKAVLATKQSLEKEFQRLCSPKCQWTVDGAPCGYEPEDDDLKRLWQHVEMCHLNPMVQENKEVQVIFKKCFCHWTGCSRRARFPNFKRLSAHILKDHVGDKEQLTAFQARLNSLENANRKPRGRRYTEAMKKVCSRHYRSRGSWERNRKVAATPLPSLGTIIRFRREIGAVKARIDFGVLEKYRDLTVGKPEYHYGILVFDEVRSICSIASGCT